MIPKPANDTDSVAPFQQVAAALPSIPKPIRDGVDIDIVHEMLRHPAELREAAFRLQLEKLHCGLTPRQAETLQFIHDHETRTGSAPSYRQIASALGLRSTAGIHRLVHGLAERGAVTLATGRSRTTRINYAKGA